MKKLLLMLIVLLTTIITFGQNLSEGFEGTTFPPAGWSVINLGDANTWVRTTSYYHTGSASAYIVYGSTAHSDYLVTPQLSPTAGNNTFSFWAENYSASYPEQFNVLLSTTGNAAANFTVTLASNVTPPTSFTQFTYSLAAYAGQNVYIAVQAISTDEFYLIVDDFAGPPLTPTAIPTAQPTSLILTPAVSSIAGSFTAASPLPSGGYLTVVSTASTLSGNPVNGTTYTPGQALGGGTVVSTTNSTTFNAAGLSASTLYYFYTFSYNTGGTGPAYLTTSPLTGNISTLAATPICGTKTIGATGADYVNLTAAMTALGNSIMTCPVTLLLNANYSSAGETFPIIVPAVLGSSATNTLTIKPNTGVTASISGSLNAAALFKILNSNTILDGSNAVGGTTRDLTITNTSVTTPQVLVVGSTGTTPITNVTVKNSIIINGINSSSAMMVSDAASPGTAGYFTNITIQNNSFQKAYIALYCIAVSAAGNGNGLGITGNAFNTSGANSIRLVGIYAQGIDGATISNNAIGNIANTLDASNISGIWLATATINTTVSGNTISAISGTSSAPRGIAISSGVVASNLMVTGNTITNITTTTTGSAMGIYFFSTTAGCTISNNMISNIKNSNSGGYLATALYLASTAAVSANCNVINNAIWDVAGYGYSSYVWNGIGMLVYSGFGYNIYHNTVFMNTEQTLATGMPSAFFVYSSVSAVGAIDLRDNIFSTTQLIGTNRYAMYCQSANTVFSNINYNDYYTTGPNIAYIGSTNCVTLIDVQTNFGGNVNSLAVNPTFVGTDLHPTNAALMHSGFYLAAVPTDITGAGRPNAPDQGAYQFSTNPVVVTNAATSVLATTATLNGTINANNATVASGYDYGLTVAYGSSITGLPASVTGASVTPYTGAVSGLTPGTLYHFRAKGISGGLTVYGSDQTFTTPILPTVVTTAATGITGTTANINGTVNANNFSTTVTFDYGLTVAYGTTVPGTPSPVGGAVVTTVTAALTGLLPGTLYHYRVNGTNAAGTVNGGDLTFTTPAMAPTAVTTAATLVTTVSATLNGTITANGANTDVWFDYGTTVAYGTTLAGTPTPVVGNTATNVSVAITGLVINTTYHFRVRGVNSVGTTNGNDMTFTTVCPSSGPAGPISGPAQVCQGQGGYVYTVTIPNASGYVWTVPVGGTITGGLNTNTITVSYAANAVSGYVFVYGTAACGNGAPSQLAIAMNPPASPTVAGPANACVNSTGNVYTTEAGKSAYVWTVSAGGSITAGAGTNAITVTWNTTGAKTVCVNYNTAAGCPALAPVCYNVTVNALPAPTISGPSPACSNYPGLVYSTQAGMSNYIWAVSAGGTITAGPGTNAITVTWNTPGAQTVSVNYTNANGCTAPAMVVYPVPVNNGAAPTITGSNNLCVNSGYYNYTTEPGMSAYTWTVSPGGSINYGGGTNVATVTWTGTGAQWVKVNYTNPSGCQAPSPTQYNVTVNPLPAATGSITGTATLCGGTQGVAYSVAPVTGATTYVWNLPAGATIATGLNTNSITVNFADNATSGNITAYANNVCGNGAASPAYAVAVTPLPATPVVTNTGYTVWSSVPTGNQWYYEGNLIPGATDQSYDCTQSGAGYYWSIVTTNGCSSDSSNHKMVLVTGVDKHSSSAISLYPVPNDGLFNVSITASNETFNISVYNSLGVKIYNEAKVDVKGSVQKVIDLRPVPNGVYTVIFENTHGDVVKKIVVNK